MAVTFASLPTVAVDVLEVKGSSPAHPGRITAGRGRAVGHEQMADSPVRSNDLLVARAADDIRVWGRSAALGSSFGGVVDGIGPLGGPHRTPELVAVQLRASTDPDGG